MKKQNITVVGIGYVGLGVGVMLSKEHNVTMLDVDQRKVDMLRLRKSPIKEDMIAKYLQKQIKLSATTDIHEAYPNADLIIVAVPTNYDEERHEFDTHIVENVINEAIGLNQNAVIVIKSTIPVGYTKGLRERLEQQGFHNAKVLFSPEFLREGSALNDNLFPSRIIVGCDKEDREQLTLAGHYLEVIRSAAEGDYQELIMGTTEAEAVKLFANTYLAMRVAYFNELDTYAETNGLSTKDIILGTCLDPRIGTQYNNPSFGYGGYCFPKDTKQLLANFNGVPQDLISAIVASNDTRKRHIAEVIKDRLLNSPEEEVALGVYRLAMKSGSDNFRQSAILDIMQQVREYGFKVYIYEPNLTEYAGFEIVNNLKEFKERATLIITNRFNLELSDVKDKVYTRDIFNNN